MKFSLSFNNDKPIYKQIADAVQEQIKSGELAEGDKLPTVRELALQLGLAKGTVKHAYDELTKFGVIEMKQGKGTFIASNSEQQLLSRKERAMQLIDTMLNELRKLSFSTRDIEIFIKLKLSEWEMTEPLVKLAVVDCNREALNSIAKQIGRSANSVEIYRMLLDDLLKNPYSIGEEVDLVVTTPTHLAQIGKLLTGQDKAVPVVLAPAQRTIVEIAKLPENAKICVVSASYRFFEIVEGGCLKVNGHLSNLKNLIFGKDVQQFLGLRDMDAMIVPPDYITYCSSEEEKLIREFSQTKPVISYEYRVDDGSMMYLSSRIKTAKKEAEECIYR